MLTRIATKQTDATRRTALQLATQLPEDVGEARAVLSQLADLLEGYLIKAPRELWNYPAAEPREWRACRAAHCYALLWSLVMLAVLAPLSALAGWFSGHAVAAGFVMFAGVSVSSLLFGQLYGVGFAALGALAQNFLVYEPRFAFTAPTIEELIRVVGFGGLAVALPLLANRAPRWRAILTGSSEVELQSRPLAGPATAAPAPVAARTSGRDRSSPA